MTHLIVRGSREGVLSSSSLSQGLSPMVMEMIGVEERGGREGGSENHDELVPNQSCKSKDSKDQYW